MRVLRTAMTVCALLCGVSAGAYAATCAQPHEEAALQVRLLQTELMVGGLACNLRQDYNLFAVDFGSPLRQHGHILKRFYARSYGVQGERRLNRFVTRLANETALRRGRDADGFCRTVARAFADLRNLPPRDLAAFASGQAGAAAHGHAVCTAVAGRTLSK